MIFTAIPPVHGHFDDLDKGLDLLKGLYNLHFGWNLCPGSMGIWPDPYYIDRKSADKDSREFSEKYFKQRSLGNKVLFVRGAHEDHHWLKRRRERGVGFELIPNLVWLADGYKTILEEDLRVTGLGGVYSPQYYDKPERDKTRLRAYRRRQVERACSSGQTDILLIHEHPSTEGVSSIVFATRPQLIIYPSKDVDYHDENPFSKIDVMCCGIPRGHHPVVFEWKNKKITLKCLE